ncbi:MAG: hypothetical protein M9918_19480 [Anaerolineae bacterium]|nr:hypothetical protein [Anaerolineae bacterium]
MKSVTIPYLNQLELPAIELRNGAFIDKRLRNALHIYPSGKSYGVKLHFAFGASDFYIIRRWAHEEIPAEFQQYVIIGNAVESYTIVRCDLTHSVLQYIKSNLPDWLSYEQAHNVLVALDQYNEMLNNLRENGLKYGDANWPQRHESMPEFAQGCFFNRKAVSNNLRDMLTYATFRRWDIAKIQYNPGIELVYTNRQDNLSGSAFSLWSDGSISHCEFKHDDPGYRGIELAPAASQLLTIALRQKCWRENDRWKKLMMVGSFQVRQLDSADIGGYGWGEAKWLEKITTDTGLTLYRHRHEGGALGEDGEAWDWASIWETEAEARREYDADLLTR